jgi:hypothetical protein
MQKQFTIVLICLLSMMRLHAQGHLKFEAVKHEFGEVKEEDGPVNTIFKFKNDGNKPIVLKSVKTSCGCTTPTWSRDTVRPGDEGFVKVEFNPMGRPGLFHKDVVIESNASNNFATVAIGGKVTPRPKGPQDFYPFEEGALRFRTNHLTYGNIYQDDTVTLSTVIYNQGKKPVLFSKSNSKVPPHLKPTMTKTTLAPGDTLTFSVTFFAGKKKDWGFVFDNIFLSTNDADKPMKRLNISAEINERFPTSSAARAQAAHISITKSEIDVGTVLEGEKPKAVFDIQNTGKSTLILRKLSAACSCITVESAGDLEPGEKGQITLTFNSRGRIGEFDKDAMLICNDPNQPTVNFHIKGKVQREETEPEGE